MRRKNSEKENLFLFGGYYEKRRYRTGSRTDRQCAAGGRALRFLFYESDRTAEKTILSIASGNQKIPVGREVDQSGTGISSADRETAKIVEKLAD